ncbi:Holliday junction branch migration protein RuvA [Pelagibaculum spongiae]|uniref:Holliday junction branch migration complex subunit RuvA n=1 Tax=Pelagibaculum spongiae TaxID=2080658 RepID=A0A2V1GWL8_9GAMM|nr:Holliday junction branch migration protein RuvA [Pelagibaculum spongiae]PVZ69448.1 Holliday junction branch migration protein RuvA [Pelagibaculum spongiae]
MIGRIRGVLLINRPPMIMLEAAGIGYEIQAPLGTCAGMPKLGQEVILWTHMSVREDDQSLFGFLKEKDRQLFRTLIKVSGVGPKLGLAILSALDGDDFVRSVRNNDIAMLERVPGIGKKTAQRLMVEMVDRLKAWQINSSADDLLPLHDGVGKGADNLAFATQEAISGLIALGYKEKDADKSIRAAASQIDITDDLDSAALIKLALKQMMRR